MGLNTVPISRLPPELLTHIFIYVALGDDSHPKASVHLSQVCSLWRAIALNCPRLWTHIHIGEQGWPPPEIIRRSKSMSLSVFQCARGAPWAMSLQPLLTEHAHRVESLHLHRIRSRGAQAIIRRFVSIAPSKLKYLVLDCHNPFKGSLFDLTLDAGPAVSPVPLPVISSDLASNLLVLKLHYCPISWDLPPLPRLEDLSITGSDNTNMEDRPTLAKLCSMLTFMPCLKRLALLNNLPAAPLTDSDFTVHLHSLQNLCIGWNQPGLPGQGVETITHFLRHITCPSNLALFLACPYIPMAPQSLSSLGLTLRRHLRNIAGRLLFELEDGMDVQITSMQAEYAGRRDVGRLDAMLTVDTSLFFEMFLSHLRPARISGAHVRIKRPLSLENLGAFFSAGFAVKILTILHFPADFAVLMTPYGGEGSCSVPWPHLQLVLIDGVPDSSTWEGSIDDGLYRWLCWRRDQGVQVPRLCFGNENKYMPTAVQRSRLEGIAEIEWAMEPQMPSKTDIFQVWPMD